MELVTIVFIAFYIDLKSGKVLQQLFFLLSDSIENFRKFQALFTTPNPGSVFGANPHFPNNFFYNFSVANFLLHFFVDFIIHPLNCKLAIKIKLD